MRIAIGRLIRLGMRVRLILIKETREIARGIARWDRHGEFPGPLIVGTGELGSGTEDGIHSNCHIRRRSRRRVIAMRNRNLVFVLVVVFL